MRAEKDWITHRNGYQQDATQKSIRNLVWLLNEGCFVTSPAVAELHAMRVGDQHVRITMINLETTGRQTFFVPLTIDGNETLLAEWETFKARATGDFR